MHIYNKHLYNKFKQAAQIREEFQGQEGAFHIRVLPLALDWRVHTAVCDVQKESCTEAVDV